MTFTVTHQDGLARRGSLTTPHGSIETPVFMPVGTQGTVKAMTPRDLEEVGAAIILGNTYHLYLRPGDDLIARRGGLHRFMGWSRPILTDSGGYQVFSLASRRTLSEDGVHFRSHLDGSAYALTPERAVDIQAQLGSDIAMVLDECPALPSTDEVLATSLELTARWAARCRNRLKALRNHDVAGVVVTNPGQAQFGIVQGGVSPALRMRSAELTVAVGFEGYAIGGLSVGEVAEQMYQTVALTAALLPADQPRYLMGVGTPIDLVECVARGIDMFDCVMPTRNARNGQLFTSKGLVNIKNARFAEDDSPPDPACPCYTCQHFSKAYLRHLFLAGEIVGSTLNTLHNLYFYLDTMKGIRDAIAFGTFEKFRQSMHRTFSRRSLTS
ncbi:MAG TPA: tRNA guanosine(34) transglycosylase Tgt [Vicinamibacterales bacterium]|nr:tRNA guanosine(34) transglycosylase Tgt [Vicinamibacterales bacterium]